MQGISYAFQVHPTRAWSGTVDIGADGTVYPPTAPVQKNGNVYTLTEDLISVSVDGVVIERSNMTLDGSGHVIQGTADLPTKGIGLRPGSNGVTIKNVKVTGFDDGIFVWSSSNICVIESNITNNVDGITLKNSSNDTIIENSITGNKWIGLVLESSQNNHIYHNNFNKKSSTSRQAVVSSGSMNTWDNGYPSGGNHWSNYNGTDLHSGPYQNETGNDGIGDTPFIIDSNNQDNYPLMSPYVPFENQTIYVEADGSVDPSGAPVQRSGDLYTLTRNITSNGDGIVIERSNVTLDGENFTVQGVGTGVAVHLLGQTNVTIRKLQINTFGSGITLSSSSNNTISEASISGSCFGINITEGSGLNRILKNKISSCSYAVYSDNAGSGNTIEDNLVISPLFGILVQWTGPSTKVVRNTLIDGRCAGILIAGTSNVLVQSNYASDCNDGLQLAVNSSIVVENTFVNNRRSGLLISDVHEIGWWGWSNIIKQNIITGNYIGLYLLHNNAEPYNDLIYHNDIMQNTHSYYLENWSFSGYPTLDSGYPSEGNYWSDYSGTDIYSGPNQDKAGSDGIGDSPYVIDQDTVDRYPLTDPWHPFESFNGISGNQAYTVEAFSNATMRDFCFNKTSEQMSFTLSGESGTMAYCRLVLPKTLINGTLTVLVNKTSIAFTSSENSTCYFLYFIYHLSFDQIRIFETITGDVNGDKKVDVQDIARVSAGFGSIRIVDPNDPEFNRYLHPTRCRTCPHTPLADINKDNKIDIQDLARTSANFGKHIP